MINARNWTPEEMLHMRSWCKLVTCMFMMTTVLVLLHTTIWSMFLNMGSVREEQFRSSSRYSPWQYVNRVDVDISSSSASQRLEGVLALRGFCAPHLDGGYWSCVMCILYFLTLTVPSLEPLSTWWPSGVKDTELT